MFLSPNLKYFVIYLRTFDKPIALPAKAVFKIVLFVRIELPRSKALRLRGLFILACIFFVCEMLAQL